MSRSAAPDPDRDPVDTLLRAAFAADRARTPASGLADRAMRRIRRRARLRSGLLGATALAGAALAAWSLGPALTAVLDGVERLPTDWSVLLTASTLFSLVWLVLAEESAY